MKKSIAALCLFVVLGIGCTPDDKVVVPPQDQPQDTGKVAPVMVCPPNIVGI